MSIAKGNETIVNPLQQSELNKKGLCDYVINVASGCLHGCSFCYVPSTPAIRTRAEQLRNKGVSNPQMDWGKYLFVRQDVPTQLQKVLKGKRTWRHTPSGKGVVMLCSGTDPYQNEQTAKVTREAIKVLLESDKRVRVLTRSPLWLKDIDLLCNKNVTVGMSLPYLDDELSRQIEPHAPLPSARYEALLKGHQAGCRLYVAVAPTPPSMTLDDFKIHVEKIMRIKPEVIFWEPINARGSNGRRMAAQGLDFVDSIMTRDLWAASFIRQWENIELAARQLGCLKKLHIWVDLELKSYLDNKRLDKWLYRPTPEKWL